MRLPARTRALCTRFALAALHYRAVLHPSVPSDYVRPCPYVGLRPTGVAIVERRLARHRSLSSLHPHFTCTRSTSMEINALIDAFFANPDNVSRAIDAVFRILSWLI